MPFPVQIAGLVALAVVTVALVFFALTRDTGASGQTGTDFTAPETTNTTEPTATVALFVGDSYVSGSRENDGPEWDDIVAMERGWVHYEDAIGGTGFLAGTDEKPTIGQRADETIAAYVPDVVVIAGGFNDADRFPTDQIVDEAATVIGRYQAAYPDAKVIVVGPWGSGAPSDDVLELSEQMAPMVAGLGLPYIDASRFLEASPGPWIGDDDVHPTNQGHEQIAAAIAPALDQALAS